MRWSSTPVRVLLLFALLTWLFFRSIGPAGNDYVFAQRDVARVSLAEAQLRADILEMRAGIVRNYDVPDRDVLTLENAAAELKVQARVRPQDGPVLDSLLAIVRQEAAGVERFKTDNAVLQNSKAYFDTLGDKLAVGGRNLAMVTAVAALGNVVLHFEDDPSEVLKRRVRDVLLTASRLPLDSATQDRQDAFRLLLAHANLLVRLVPQADDDVRALFDISTYDTRQAIRRGQDARRLSEERTSGRYRVALYIVAVFLAVRLAKVALDWRAGVMLLRQRADAERLVGDVSARLVAAPLDGHGNIIDDVLERLGSGFGADRAYYIKLEPFDVRSWSRPGLHWPAGWPRDLIEPTLATISEGSDLLDATSIGRLPPGSLRDALTGSGLTGWCGMVLRRGDDRPVGILGFDLVAPSAPWPRGGVGMVRLAGEVLQSALLRRRAALDRRELEERLGRARRLEVVGAFASGIAHNVNNVVAAVMGHAEMALDAAEAGGDPTHHIREISRAGERAQELVAAILRFATRSSTQKRLVDMSALLDETVSMARVQLSGSIELEAHIPAASHHLRGDAASLQQILLNLVRNADQAIEESGRIVIVMSIDRVIEQRVLSHDVQLPGEYVRIEVSDDGQGMEPRVLERIFEPFFTSRPAGTGLGLATVREIVHDHSGFLDVDSAPGRGSAFRVWLPLADMSARSVTPRRGSGEPVLVVGAQREQRCQDEDMLAALGYEPIGVPDAEAAAARSRCEAILLDVGAVSPLDLVRRLRAAGANPPVIVVTSRDSASGIADLAAEGVVAVLRRPLRSAAVADALSSCLLSLQGSF